LLQDIRKKLAPISVPKEHKFIGHRLLIDDYNEQKR